MRTTTVLKKDTYYQHRCPPESSTLILVQDVENYPVAVPLRRDEIILCTGFVRRNGARYARLLNWRGEEHPAVTLFVRVSRSNRGSLHWVEANPMLVIASVDKIPTL